MDRIRPPGNTSTRISYLLEHLVDVGQHSSVHVTVLVQGETVSEAALSHLEDGILNGLELALDLGVIFGEVGKGAEDVQRFSFATFEDQP